MVGLEEFRRQVIYAPLRQKLIGSLALGNTNGTPHDLFFRLGKRTLNVKGYCSGLTRCPHPHRGVRITAGKCVRNFSLLIIIVGPGNSEHPSPRHRCQTFDTIVVPSAAPGSLSHPCPYVSVLVKHLRVVQDSWMVSVRAFQRRTIRQFTRSRCCPSWYEVFFFFFKSVFVFRNSNMKMSKTRWGEPIRYVRGGGKGK